MGLLKNKKGEMDGFGKFLMYGVLILAVIYFVSPQTLQSIGGKEGADKTTEEVLSSPNICTGDKTNTFAFGPLFTKYGAQITSGENVAWWRNGVYQGTNAVDSTTSLTFQDKLGFLVGLDSTTRYANYFEAEMPCGATNLGNIAKNGENQLWTADTDFTINLFNSDNGLLNAVGTNETIESGEQGSWDVKIESTSEQAISPNGKILLVLGQEKNNFTSSEATWEGQSPSKSIPAWFSTVNNFVYSVWEIDGCPTTGKACAINGKLTVKAKDGVNPTTSSGTGMASGMLNFTVVNSDYDIDTNSNLIMGGAKPVYEDNDGAISGFVTDGLTIYIQ